MAYPITVQTKNLSEHGLHPRVTHVLVNMPMLYGPLCVPAAAALWRALELWTQKPNHAAESRLRAERAQWRASMRSRQGLATFITAGTVVCGLAGLSLAPHQEPRFLVPTVVPMCVLFGDQIYAKERAGRRTRVIFWLGFNTVVAFFFGVLHQVMQAVLHAWSCSLIIECVCVDIYIYIYIYIYIVCVDIYIYIYILCVLIYIYIYKFQQSCPLACRKFSVSSKVLRMHVKHYVFGSTRGVATVFFHAETLTYELAYIHTLIIMVIRANDDLFLADTYITLVLVKQHACECTCPWPTTWTEELSWYELPCCIRSHLEVLDNDYSMYLAWICLTFILCAVHAVLFAHFAWFRVGVYGVRAYISMCLCLCKCVLFVLTHMLTPLCEFMHVNKLILIHAGVQGGVTRAASWLSSHSALEKRVIWWRTYMPPIVSLMQAPAKHAGTELFDLHLSACGTVCLHVCVGT